MTKFYTSNPVYMKNRLVVLSWFNHKCAWCDKNAKHVHHIDGSKTNHELWNLLPLCTKCHLKKAHKTRNTVSGLERKTYFVKEFGMTAVQIANKFNIKPARVYQLSARGQVGDLLNGLIS